MPIYNSINYYGAIAPKGALINYININILLLLRYRAIFYILTLSRSRPLKMFFKSSLFLKSLRQYTLKKVGTKKVGTKKAESKRIRA